MVYLALVEGKRGADVAREVDGDRNVVYVLKKRFLELMQRDSMVKVPVDAFIASVPPASNPFKPFEADIRKLSAGGYSAEQIQDFLQKNGIDADINAITMFLKQSGGASNSEHGGNP
jgi:hypothetical protein